MSKWIKWEGGENPVPGKKVKFALRDGEEGSYASDALDWRYDNEEGWGIVEYCVIEDEPKSIRTFETGATRDTNTDKLDYKGFLSMIAINQFAEYMHKNRKQADGSMRNSDNWKLGIDIASYEESLTRHFFEFLTALEKGDRDKAYEIAPAIFFNLQGWMHEEGKLRDEQF